MNTKILSLALCIFFPSLHATQGVVRIAIASNFSGIFSKIQKEFEIKYQCRILPSYGATSKLYQQICNGAPFDVFLSADREHIKKIIDQGMGEKKTYYTYAVGQLVLYVPGSTMGREINLDILTSDNTKRIAIAHPETAPYGQAAQKFLKGKNVWDQLYSSSRIITAENVGQTMNFVLTKSVDAGFVAKSQTLDANVKKSDVYEIEGPVGRLPQGAVILKNGQKNTCATEFMNFIKTDTTQQMIRDNGYVNKTPQDESIP